MMITRPLGTMVTYGFVENGLAVDLAIAARLGATVLEILPDWRAYPDPGGLKARVADSGLAVHSAHGCWGGQAIRAARVDLGSIDPKTHRESVDDLSRCVDWLRAAGGRFLVVHPGGLSDAEARKGRREALVRGLGLLADRAKSAGVTISVENMPPGVHPGSRMADLAEIVAEIDRPDDVGLAVDTGHAHISATAGGETLAAGPWLRTTHVHDNDGRQDTHLPPGLGSLDWDAWVASLDVIGYRGPIVLECIRHLRRDPACLTPDLFARLRFLTRTAGD